MRMQTQLEWEAEMAGRVLDEVRTEIYLALRYLDGALARLGYAADLSVRSLATDGEKLFYPPERLLDIWKKNPVFVNRAYLHTLLHCIFLHLWTRSGREKVYWDTACDIVVEGIIDSLHDPAFKRPVSWTRQKTEQLRKSQRLISPAAVYSWLLELPEDEFTALRREYYTDDHRYWPDEQQMAANPSAGEDWKRESSRVQSELETHGSEQGDQAEAIAAQIKAGKSRRSYREFLRRFCALREEIKIDPDSFDPGLYTYGLSLYGNLPLIEPLESREEMRIEDFVIVIDTSFSTSGKLVQAFLRETFSLLIESGIFLDRCRVRVLQCDDAVREDTLLTSPDQMRRMADNFTIIGGGGTDFRPAFRYLYQLKEKGELKGLRGMLYFTDGKGIYPNRRPPWETVFVFADEETGGLNEAAVPGWAMRLTLDHEQLSQMGKGTRL